MTTGGTRFRLFPQYDEGMAAEIVTVSSPAGSVGAGPADAAMHVADPVRKLQPYDPPTTLPPYPGQLRPPARPDRRGHFDHIDPLTPQFLAAHLFGVVRRTLDVWEGYLGRRIRWWHADEFPALELVPMVAWQNAQSGPGFLETGVWPAGAGQWQPLALNHDIISHEIGHTLMFSTIGVPPPEALGAQFLAFHESFADLVAMITALRYGSVRRRLLHETDGDLYVLNLVSRIGETSSHQQIRIASNTRTMDDVAGIALNPDMTWHDPSGQGRNAHALAEPLTGAIFDVLVELYQDALVAGRLIASDNDPRGWTRAEVDRSLARLHGASALALARFEPGFEAALNEARDVIAVAMAHVMNTIEAEQVAFPTVAARLLEGLARRGLGPKLGLLVGYFLRRGIDPRPYLRFRPVRPRAEMVVVEPAAMRPCPCGQPAHVVAARRLMTHSHRGA